MRQLRICIGSNDGRNIANTHMGDTAFFLIYELTDDMKSKFIEQRTNTAKALDHAQTDKMKHILALVNDSDILVAQRNSPNFRKIAQQTEYQPVVVKADAIEAVLHLLLKHFEEMIGMVELRKVGKPVTEIPEFAH